MIMNPKDLPNSKSTEREKAYSKHPMMKPLNKLHKFRKGAISIQASEYHYCTPRKNHGPYTAFEVAYMVNDSFTKIPELDDNGDDVYPNVPIETVLKLLIREGYKQDELIEILPK